MRGWWRCPSGLGSDLRWAALSMAARGLLATLADAADGTGAVDIGNVPLTSVLRAAAPGETSEARDALWSELLAAGFAGLEGGALWVTLPGAGRAVAFGEPTQGDDGGEGAEDRGEALEGPRDAFGALRAAFSRRGLKTAETRLAWLATDEGAKVVARLGVDPAEARTLAERTGSNVGRFGSDGRTPVARTDARRSHACDRDGRTPVARSLPSHTLPSERETEKEGAFAHETPAEDGRTPVARTDARDGDDGRTVARSHGRTLDARSHDPEAIETALANRSRGRVDLLSAPASSRVALRELLSEMAVDLPLAEVMGELASKPEEVWPWARDTRRVTVNFLLGKVDNSGTRAAVALVELVSRARAQLLERGTSAPEPAPAPRPRSSPLTPADSAEALRVAQEFAARRRTTQEPPHVP